MPLLRSLALTCLAALAFSGCKTSQGNPGGPRSGVQVIQEGSTVKITIRGEPFADYHYQNVSRPYLFPIHGPGGLKMTRNWPMAEFPGEEHDHPHHRSFWYAHGEINGQDFWSEGDKAGKTLHDRFIKLGSDRQGGIIKTANKLVAKDGTIVATDERTIRILDRVEDRVMDFEITIFASHGELKFGDTKEGSMALRLAETMRLKGKVGKGHIVNSEGVRDADTWGKRAKWVDYHGPVDGQTVGVALFDHPSNPRHPTWWHVRDYGLFAANPFGLHDFEKKPAGAGDFVVKAGGKVTFKYRFYFHRGDELQSRVAEKYAEYTGLSTSSKSQSR